MVEKEGSTRPGPVYDPAMKVLAHDDLDAVLSLVGVHGHGAQPLKTELPGSTMHADLIARTADGIVHIEFVKDRDPNLDLRMVAYWRRIRAQDGHRHTPLAQFVLVLGDDLTVPDRRLDGDREVLRWSVVRLATWTRRRCSPARPPRRSRRSPGAPPPNGRDCSPRPRS